MNAKSKIWQEKACFGWPKPLSSSTYVKEDRSHETPAATFFLAKVTATTCKTHYLRCFWAFWARFG
jgi:hypothetical protein